MLNAKSCQSCPTLCNPVDYSPPGSSIHGIIQARIQEWVAFSFSKGSSHPGNKPVSLTSPTLAVRFFTTSATQEALDHKNQPQNQVLKYSEMLVLESRSQCKWVLIVKFFQLYYMFENFHNKILRDQKPLLCFRSVEVQ